jgi:transposase
MYLRPHQRSKDGKEHSYWSLVETVRTPDGPRQGTLCYLGELNTWAQARWQKTIEVFNEQGQSRQLKLFPANVEVPDDDPNVARVLINKVRVERSRQFGSCFVGLEVWRRLGLDAFFQETIDDEAAEVRWSRTAAVLAINRLCAPGSELAIEERWYPATALDDLLGIAEGKLNDTRLYRCLDRLLPAKTKLERHLKERYGELFEAEFDVLLYDLTSSYVEGAAEANPLMRRGYSRDHRPDCEQVVIALIVNVDGFPISYETFNGNRNDAITLEAVLRMVERKHGRARRVWVFDRGVVSEENLAILRKHNGQYLVGTPRSKLKEFERALLEGGWEQVRPEVEVKCVPMPGGEETFILCRTAGRSQKEKAMRSRFSTRLEKSLTALAKSVAKGRLKDRFKIERRLGRLQERYPQVADLYEMKVGTDNGQLHVDWKMLPHCEQWQQAREGAYLLRTNLRAESASELWKKYIQLTEAEAAFRTLKSELAVRPFFHQLEPRVKAHILVAFLGYALWVTMKHLLRRNNSSLSPARALSLLSTIHSVDVVLPTTDGREIRLRRLTTPSPQQQQVLHDLGMLLPDHLENNLECSADSTTA